MAAPQKCSATTNFKYTKNNIRSFSKLKSEIWNWTTQGKVTDIKN